MWLTCVVNVCGSQFHTIRKLVYFRGTDTGDIVQRPVSHLPETHIVDQDVQDVGPFTPVLPADFRQLGINFFVFFCSLFTILGFKKIVFPIMNDLAVLLRRHCTDT